MRGARSSAPRLDVPPPAVIMSAPMTLREPTEPSAKPRSREAARTSGAPDGAARNPVGAEAWKRFLAVALQFGAVCVLVRLFAIESKAFEQLLLVAFGGFFVHHLLPARLRLACFAALSLVCACVVLGAGNAAWLVGLGAVLIGLAHAPIAFGLRVAAIVAVGTAFVVVRSGAVSSSVPGAVWPILGSMFMFRMVVYLYDLANKAAPTGFWRAFGYFFMLPNVAVPLFPVVDYKKFCASHYNEPWPGIYQRGIVFLVRGLVHLLLYRLVYQNFLVPADAVVDAGTAAQWVLSTYLLYLRLSGSFHLVVGVLHLFGFNLSETHHFYLLSSSFTDYWRRINIYWKDFVQKIVFNPVYMRVHRRIGAKRGLVVSTIVAFAATWALHSYQWFWIRGDFPITWQDVGFWGLLGALVLANVMWENSRPKQSRLKKEVRRDWKADLAHAGRTIGTFIVLSLCWSMWTCGSADELVTALSGFLKPSLGSAAAILGFLVVLGIAAIAFGKKQSVQTEFAPHTASLNAPREFWRSTATVALACGAMFAVAAAPASGALDPDTAATVERFREGKKLNTRDAEMMERGYYEDLTNPERFNNELAQLYRGRPVDWNNHTAMVETGGLPHERLAPNARIQFKGHAFTTNSHGMRDQEYALEKPAGTLRIALLGASHAWDEGVGDGEAYEALVETRLNAELGAASEKRVEVLNFATRRYGPLSRLGQLDQRVFEFAPDGVIIESVDDVTWITREVGEAAHRGFALPYPELAAFVERAEAGPGVPRATAERRIKPQAPEMLRIVYRLIAERCRAHGATPFMTFIPLPEERDGFEAAVAPQVAEARAAGFEILDTSKAYAGVDRLEALWVAEYDRHPNREGHARLAKELHAALRPWVERALRGER